MSPVWKRALSNVVKGSSSSADDEVGKRGALGKKSRLDKLEGSRAAVNNLNSSGGEICSHPPVQAPKNLQGSADRDAMVNGAASGAFQARSSGAPGRDENGLRKAPLQRLKIRTFERPPRVPDDYFARLWNEQLLLAVRAIFNRTGVAYSDEELYQKVEDICRGKRNEWLLERLQEECDRHVSSQMRTLVENLLGAEALLSMLDRVWQNYLSELTTVKSIFLVLDRMYHKEAGSSKLWDMGTALFQKHFLAAPDLLEKVKAGILVAIEKDRAGEVVDRSLLKRLFNVFTETKLYKSHLEGPFLEATANYYMKESFRKLDELDIAGYSLFVEKQIAFELERVKRYLDESTHNALMYVVDEWLLSNHVEKILNNGFEHLCKDARVEDIARVYKQFGRVEQHRSDYAYQHLRRAFAKVINNQAVIVTNPQQDDTMVQSLLDLKDKIDLIVSEGFMGDTNIAKAAKQAFEELINKRQNKPPELVAKHIDQILKAGNKKYSEVELENALDKLMVLFRCIHGKDIFQAFYQKDLAKRFLFDRTASLDVENLMISKLKMECGASFTMNLESMFKDINSSADIMKSFYDSRRSASQLGNIELKVNVLTSSAWAALKDNKVKLPAELQRQQRVFDQFYRENNRGKILTWQNANSTCVLTANFPRRTHFLSVSLYHACVLLLFNDAEELTYSDIREKTGLEPNELKRTLLSLACGKHHVIQKRPKGRTVSETDTFVYARDFCKQLVSLRITSVQMQTTPLEEKETKDRVKQMRVHLIEPTIVRCMKSRQIMTHSELVEELCQQLKFPVDVKQIKKHIEALIDRSFIERDEKDSQKYKYLA